MQETHFRVVNLLKASKQTVMGLIVDGTASGKLPEHVSFAVNYPGYASSVERAIETLGGQEAISKARGSEINFLELKFRPEDPYSHPAFGELNHSSDLVLRISRKRKAAVTDAVQNNITTISISENVEDQVEDDLEKAEEVHADIVMKVEHTYAFEGMADYQYVVAVHADANKGNKRKGPQQEKGSLLDMEQGEMLMLVPPLFSVKDLPEDIFLRPPGGKKRKQRLLQEPVNQEIVVPFALDFKIKEVPRITTWKQQLDEGSDSYQRTEALVKLFEERPVWAKSTLNERLIEQEIFVTDAYLRSLLFRISYYFGCGPFRNLWIRNGYDPRGDPESRKYQMIDFRVPIPLRDKPGSTITTPPVQPSWKDLCSFKAVPQKRFTIFQMYDLEDEVIQAEISKPPERATCGETTGWYRLSTIQKLRAVVRVRFLALYQDEVARSLESVELKNLNRPWTAIETEDEPTNSETQIPDKASNSERREENVALSLKSLQPEALDLREHVDDMREDVPGSQGVEEEVEEEDEDEEDEEEEEEELEDEEDDEELEDLDESYQKGIPGVHTPILQEYMDPADSIPKNYLQALLGKFSFEGDGIETPGQGNIAAKGDDGEYIIYEQDDEDDDD